MGPATQALVDRCARLAVLGALFGLFQLGFPAIRRKPKARTYEFWLDLVYYFQPVVLQLTAYGVVLELTRGALVKATPVLFPSLAKLHPVLQILVAIWAFDFLVYWRHRFFHFALWPVHEIHHTAKQVDWMTTTRLHVIESFVGAVSYAWATLRLGPDTSYMQDGFLLYVGYNYWIHTNVRIKYPGFLRYVFVSPLMHRWHHATDESARDKNFGVVFAWNDWLFRSAYLPDDEPKETGVVTAPDEALRESYLAHLIHPFRIAARRLRALVTARP